MVDLIGVRCGWAPENSTPRLHRGLQMDDPLRLVWGNGTRTGWLFFREVFLYEVVRGKVFVVIRLVGKGKLITTVQRVRYESFL